MRLAIPVSFILLVSANLAAFALPHGETRSSTSNSAPKDYSQTFPDIEQRSPTPSIFDILAKAEKVIDEGVTGLVNLIRQGHHHKRDLPDPQEELDRFLHLRSEELDRLLELNERDLTLTLKGAVQIH